MSTQEQYEAAWAAWLKALHESKADPSNKAKRKSVETAQARVEGLCDVRMRELHRRST